MVDEADMDRYFVMSMPYLLAVELHMEVVIIEMINRQITAINSMKKRSLMMMDGYVKVSVPIMM
jgi:hypothetical protein